MPDEKVPDPAQQITGQVIPPISPTGKPLVPPAVVPYILGALAVVGVLIGAGLDPDQAGPAVAMLPALTPYVGYLTVLEGLLFAALGASPGVRRAAPLLLAGVLAASTLTGCTAGRAIGKATVDCSAKALADGAQGMMGTVLDILGGPTADYRERLDRLALTAGSAVAICAVQSAVAYLEGELQKRSACGTLASCYSGGDPMAELKVARARAWLAVNGVGT